MEEEEKAVIKSTNLNLFYGDVHALKDINLSIPKKKINGLIGPSGCGKSTFLRCINRMNDFIYGVKITGSLQVGGEEVYSKNINITQLRKKVGMVFQTPNPFPFSIYDNVAYGPRIWGIQRKADLDVIVEKSLKAAALWDEVKDKLKTSATSLSGGQQQRLSIARTLAIEPKIILMDEPTSALDPISTKKIEELVITLKKDYTIIIVTHNMQQAARIADNIAFFYLGGLVEFGSSGVIFTNPQNKLTEEYITGRFG
jgi:phosphate transport system ATP-binding protein